MIKDKQKNILCNFTLTIYKKIMNKEFQCTKIKDCLYIGNIVAAHDYQFLLSNKFAYVVNCTSEIPNFFQQQNFAYLKFKLVDNKPHKLWDENLKKLTKLQKFIEESEQNSLCVLFHSFHGQNRCIVFVVAYLMKKYQWKLKKTIQFLKSKGFQIKLSAHYISQLQILQQILDKKFTLSSVWTYPYLNKEQQIIAKTYLNSLDGKQFTNLTHQKQNLNYIQQQKCKPQRRITWLDRLEKKRRKQAQAKRKDEQMKFQQQKQEILSRKSSTKIKQASSTHILINHSQKDISKLKQTQLNNKILRKVQKLKQKQQQKDKNVYQVTINNYISPNFNIINKSEPLLTKSQKQVDLIQNHKEMQQQMGQKGYKSQNEKKIRPKSAKGKYKHQQKQKSLSINKQTIKKQKMLRAKSQKQVNHISNDVSKSSTKVKKSIPINNFITKQRDIKKQLRKELEKVQRDRIGHPNHSNLNSLHVSLKNQGKR